MNKAIKKIELDLGGKVVSLTPEQAKNLKDALDELFGKAIREKEWDILDELKKLPTREKEYIPYPVPYQPYYPRPYYWEWQPSYLYDKTTCGGTGDAYTDGVYDTDKVRCMTLRLTG